MLPSILYSRVVSILDSILDGILDSILDSTLVSTLDRTLDSILDSTLDSTREYARQYGKFSWVQKFTGWEPRYTWWWEFFCVLLFELQMSLAYCGLLGLQK